jgi:multisubunit Na+/H+ antiporter MnhC subunit
MAILFIYTLLILLCLIGVFGLFLAKEYIKKISCLSVAYTSFIVFVILISSKSQNYNNVLLILISATIIFAVNLLVGIGIAKNISKIKEKAVKS